MEAFPTAVILSGGLGTRLRSVYTGPKSMAPVAGRPFLDYLLCWLRRQGVRDVVLCVGYKRAQIHKFVGDGSKWALRITYSVEQQLLGTAGAIKKAEHLIPAEKFILVNGDSFVDVSLDSLLAFHSQTRAVATLVAAKVADSGRYGSIRLNRQGRITAMAEKTAASKTHHTFATRKRLINGGVYLFEKKLLNIIPRGRPFSLERQVLPPLLAREGAYGFESGAYFLDIGVPEDLGRAQRELPKRISVCHPC